MRRRPIVLWPQLTEYLEAVNNVNEFMARVEDPTIIQAMLDLQAAKKLNVRRTLPSSSESP
mgnify:CR=1 FL=1